MFLDKKRNQTLQKCRTISTFLERAEIGEGEGERGISSDYAGHAGYAEKKRHTKQKHIGEKLFLHKQPLDRLSI